jgi:hypothetical protein
MLVGVLDIPFIKPKSFGFSTAGQKKRRKRKPETLLKLTLLRKSP